MLTDGLVVISAHVGVGLVELRLVFHESLPVFDHPTVEGVIVDAADALVQSVAVLARLARTGITKLSLMARIQFICAPIPTPTLCRL